MKYIIKSITIEDNSMKDEIALFQINEDDSQSISTFEKIEDARRMMKSQVDWIITYNQDYDYKYNAIENEDSFIVSSYYDNTTKIEIYYLELITEEQEKEYNDNLCSY